MTLMPSHVATGSHPTDGRLCPAAGVTR